MSWAAKELEKYLEENTEDLFEYKNPWSGISELGFFKGPEEVELDGFGMLQLVEHFGGEGMGDTQWVVFSVGDRLFRKTGYYDSWNGGEWDGAFEEVEPREVTVTQYFAKGSK